MRVFAPGFGAGAVGGYAVLRVDPADHRLSPVKPSEHATDGGFVAPSRT